VKQARLVRTAANPVPACTRASGCGSRCKHRARERLLRSCLAAGVSAVLALVVLAAPAGAESCTKSRDYIFMESSGDLPQKSKVYQDLVKNCLDTLLMANVKDAFILKGGAIAVIPKDDGVTATTNTLAQFCGRFRGGSLRFIARRELPEASNMARAVRLSSTGSISCRKITGS
jgi:hypothetical protein